MKYSLNKEAEKRFTNATNYYQEYRPDYPDALLNFLLEKNVIGPQLTLNGIIDSSYVHEHVLRDMLTSYNGIKLDAEKVAGRTFVKEFALSPFPDNFKISDCTVVAFIHELVNSYKVYHAAQVDIQM